MMARRTNLRGTMKESRLHLLAGRDGGGGVAAAARAFASRVSQSRLGVATRSRLTLRLMSLLPGSVRALRLLRLVGSSVLGRVAED